MAIDFFFSSPFLFLFFFISEGGLLPAKEKAKAESRLGGGVVKLAGDDKAEPGGHPLLQHRGDPAVGVELTPEERLPEIKLGSKGEDGLALLRVGEDLNLRADGDLLVHLVEIGGLDGTVQPQVPRGDEVRPGVATNKGHPRVQGPAWTLLDQRLHSEGQISGQILQVVHDKDASSLDGLRIPRNEKKLILFETGEAAER